MRRADDSQKTIAPWEITKNPAGNPIVSLAARRPDFNGTLMQFLIGLLQTTVAPEDEGDWEKWLESPPPPEQLKERFETVAYAFDLDGDGPRFMQDFDLPDVKPWNISLLFIDAPSTHFIKRGVVKGVCPSCAAVSLFTLQTNAPEGGRGHRTSLRGGGPLSTLVIFDPNSGKGLPATLWRNLWLNILEKESFLGLSGNRKKEAASDTFPWMAKTRTSEATYQQDVHPAQMFWAMPRRIRLDFDKAEKGNCDICGRTDKLVSRYHTRPHGVNYEGAWRHPLSPYYYDKQKQLLPCHAGKFGRSYRHWLGLVGTDSEKSIEQARVIGEFIHRRKGQDEQLLVWAFGYDMKQNKPLCWYESMMPIYQLEDEVLRGEFEDIVKMLVNTANGTGGFVSSCIKEAWAAKWDDNKKVRMKSKAYEDWSKRTVTQAIDKAFWQETETAFYQRLAELVDALKTGEEIKYIRKRWYKNLRNKAEALFNNWVMSQGFEGVDMKRVVKAHKELDDFLSFKLKVKLGLKG